MRAPALLSERTAACNSVDMARNAYRAWLSQQGRNGVQDREPCQTSVEKKVADGAQSHPRNGPHSRWRRLFRLFCGFYFRRSGFRFRAPRTYVNEDKPWIAQVNIATV